MRIAFDAKRIFHNFRGLGHYGRTLVEGLSTYYPENEYILYTPPIKDPRATDWRNNHPKIEVRTPTSILGQAFPSWWRSVFLAKILFTDKLDIYHGLSHELPPGIERSRLKSIVTIHDTIFIKFPHFFPWVDRQVYRHKFSHSCRAADIVVAICEQTKRDLIEHFQVEEGKIRVVYQSCDPVYFMASTDEKKDQVKAKYGLPKNYVLNVASFEENKNILGLLDAFHQMKKSTSIHLVLVNSKKGEYEQKVLSKIKKLRIKDRVTILNDVSTLDLPAIYQMAELFVFPSFYEGFGIPIIESLFSGVPVITSKGGSFFEAGGEGALYVDPHSPEELAHAMERVVHDVVLKKNLMASGIEHVQKFHLKKTSANMISVYQEVMKSL